MHIFENIQFTILRLKWVTLLTPVRQKTDVLKYCAHIRQAVEVLRCTNNDTASLSMPREKIIGRIFHFKCSLQNLPSSCFTFHKLIHKRYNHHIIDSFYINSRAIRIIARSSFWRLNWVQYHQRELLAEKLGTKVSGMNEGKATHKSQIKMLSV